MIRVEWSTPKKRGGKTVPDIDAAEVAVRNAIFADAGNNLVEGHGVLCQHIGGDMQSFAETELIVNGRWSWSGHGYSVVLTPA